MKIEKLLLALVLFCTNVFAQQNDNPTKGQILPIGGNTWQITGDVLADEIISDNGLVNWKDSKASFKTYFRSGHKGDFQLWLTANKPSHSSVLQISLLDKTVDVTITPENYQNIYVGKWSLPKSGYFTITTTAKSKQADEFASVKEFIVEGESVDTDAHWVRNNQDNYFYWGRRGPSVHLKYNIPTKEPIEYYYNEITVDKGQDIIGSYYMANGFTGGYFGMQVNSDTQRRILFSVWSPFVTDNPQDIPLSDQILVDRKGAEVRTGEFGNEGSGGQSYMVFDWKPDTTYKFLLKGTPIEDNYTQYTAWFFAPEVGQWQLIASFKRPKTNQYLTGFHSFLENFLVENGDQSREVSFSNQWVRDIKGNWIEVTKTDFTYDNTAKMGYRMDYQGGENQKGFYLRNGGFFDQYTPYGTSFTRKPSKQMPQVDVDRLP
ncbi:DUF3472 domain-containing protein [Myroides sp. LJL115]